MNNLTGYIRRSWLLLLFFLLGFPVRADIVYPARMQLTEITPGMFEVIFILPVINGKILKAEPVFPEFCSPITQPEIQIDSYQKKSSWKIQCEFSSLHGQQIGIEGLLGSPIDIILEVKTLDGRNYKTTLSPTQAYYQIPAPPDLSDYLSIGTLNGSRNVLLQWGLALLLVTCLLPSSGFRFRRGFSILFLAVALGYFLNVQELLLVPSWAGSVAALLTALVLLVPIAFGRDSSPPGVINLFLFSLTGLLIGAGLPIPVSYSGFTLGELVVLTGFTILGLLLGLLLLGLLVRQLLKVFSLGGDHYRTIMAKCLSGLSLGILIWKLSLFWNFPSMIPSISLVLFTYALSLAVWVGYSQNTSTIRISFLTLPALALGYFSGVGGSIFPYGWAVLLVVQGILMITVFFHKSLPKIGQIILLLAGGMIAGNHLFYFTSETLSYAHARSVFFVVLLFLLVLLCIAVIGWVKSDALRKKQGTVASGMVGLFLVLLGILMYLQTYQTTLSYSLSEGSLPIPFLSLGLLAIAFTIWPKHRKIHRQMGLKRKAPAASLGVLAAAFFFLPVCTDIPNPWFTMDRMNEEELKRVVEKRLWNTYTAFNMPDEEEVFEQLADNLDEDLLDHIYLDSRRRLTMGLREGSEVTVKEVSLSSLGEPETETGGIQGHRYPASWTVTARVKHLKHIHYRKNQYRGTIALKPMENGWKIAEIILTSEDRQVIASGSL